MMETEVRQIVADLGIDVATKKIVCRKYCELHNIPTKIPSATKAEIQKILELIVNELAANPQASICLKENDDKSFCAVNRAQQVDSNNSSPLDNLTFNTCSLVNDRLHSHTAKVKDKNLNITTNSPSADVKISQSNSSNNEENVTTMKKTICNTDSRLTLKKAKVRLARLRSKDVLDMVTSTDHTEVSSDGFSSPSITPQKNKSSLPSPKAICNSPIVRPLIKKSRKKFVLNSSDSESDDIIADKTQSLAHSEISKVKIEASSCLSDGESSPDEFLHHIARTADRFQPTVDSSCSEDDKKVNICHSDGNKTTVRKCLSVSSVSDLSDAETSLNTKDKTTTKEAKKSQSGGSKRSINFSKKRRHSSSSSRSDISDAEMSLNGNDKTAMKEVSKFNKAVKNLGKKSTTVTKEKKRKINDSSGGSNKKLEHLRKVCRSIGVILRNSIELKDCETDDEKVRRIRNILQAKGLKANPTQKAIEQYKLERELAELGGAVDHSSSERKSRSRMKCQKESPPKSTSPAVHPCDSLRSMFGEDDLSD